MEISAETLTRIADRLTELAAHIHALQVILVEKKVMTVKEYGEVLEQWRAILANQPDELAWKEALQTRPGDDKK